MPCADGKPGLNGQLCPDIENAPQTIEEIAAFDVILASIGQLRFSSVGRPTGIDMAAVLSVMKARGQDGGEIVELIGAAEEGMIAALNKED